MLLINSFKILVLLKTIITLYGNKMLDTCNIASSKYTCQLQIY